MCGWRRRSISVRRTRALARVVVAVEAGAAGAGAAVAEEAGRACRFGGGGGPARTRRWRRWRRAQPVWRWRRSGRIWRRNAFFEALQHYVECECTKRFQRRESGDSERSIESTNDYGWRRVFFEIFRSV